MSESPAVAKRSDSGTESVSPFAGLVPTRLTAPLHAEGARHRGETPRLAPRVGQGLTLGLAATMPVLLAGAMGVTAQDIASPAHAHRAKSTSTSTSPDPSTSRVTPSTSRVTIDATAASATSGRGGTAGTIDTASVVVPATYTVRAGDTVSGIAAHYGLSTATVLALNGLSWKSLIFPRQVLRLTKASSTATPPATTTPVTPPVTTPPVTPPASSTPPATPPTTPSAPSTPVTSIVKYVIHSGDTVTAIAKKFGVTVQAILTANHLVASSIIYTGRTLVIPGTSASSGSTSSGAGTTGSGTGTAPASTGGTSNIVPLSASMEANAKVIVSVGKSLGVPTYGLVIALAAAMQESSLQNLTYGDRDSVGLFQQRPSSGWGTVAQLETPSYAAELFFGGPKNPNKGKTRGLLDISGWQSMTVTQAAQAVQISGNPTAYAKWEASARAWVAQLG